MNQNPIGFFDSGVGGLSIWKEVHEMLPYENSIYLADGINAPYGEKSTEKIIDFSVKNTDFLLNRNCKMIVVACNTATTNAIGHLREQYDIPFIGIEPATKPAAINTKTGTIGVLATQGTLISELFLETSLQFRGKVEIIEQAGVGLVDLIENGDLESTKPLLKKYLQPMIEKNADKIVLGCSHYPFLSEIIQELTPNHVDVLDSGYPVAKQIKRILEINNLKNTEKNRPSHVFYTNRDLNVLQFFLDKMIGLTQFNAHFLKF